MAQLRRCDIIVIGGSAGALDPLKSLLARLPAGFPAAIFVVLHLSPEFPSYLAEMIGGFAALPAVIPTERQKIKPGTIYVAPPDHHLLIDDGRVEISRGPRENRHRPAIDPLFRSAAREYGARVAAVVLSGNLDDGSSGLMAIKMRGGLTVVQGTSEALYTEMPTRAKAYAGADYELPAAEIADLLIKACTIGMPARNGRPGEKPMDEQMEAEAGKANLKNDANQDKAGKPSEFACPECHGVMWEMEEGQLLRFRCRVGHAYTADALRMALSDSIEEALWAAIRALDEKAALLRRLGSRIGRRIGNEYVEEAQAVDKHVETIRKMLMQNPGVETEALKKAGSA